MSDNSQDTSLQVRNSWCPESIRKIAKGWLIVLRAIIIMIVPVLANELIQYLEMNDPINWRMMLALVIGALSTGVVNTLKEYRTGEVITQS